MFGLCKYRNALGVPGKGIHRFRIFNIAIVDVLFTIIAAYFLHLVMPKQLSFVTSLIGLFLLGIILHHVFCVRTTIDKLLFPKAS